MKNKRTYTTDVAHCMGRACVIRDKCYRYWLLKEQCKKVLNGFLHPKDCVPFIEEQYDYKTEQCEMYKPINIKEE